MSHSTTEACAAELLEVIPLVFRTIRSEMRQRRGGDLSIPQFRALIFLNRQPGASLSELAEYLGLTSATSCRMIDDLVERGLVSRAASTVDRRRVALRTTARGDEMLSAARQGTLQQLARLLEPLPPDERTRITLAVQQLRLIFSTQD